MALRFAREANHIKNRVPEALKGMRYFPDKLSWRANKFHYENQMKDRAQKALFTDMYMIENLQMKADEKFGVQMQTPRYFKYAIPEIRPFRRSSNPFCKASHNFTGWSTPIATKLGETRPRRHRVPIGGTDTSTTPPGQTS